jgi:hypothetical protein
MDDAHVERIRERARRMRRVAEMAHDPRMIEILLRMADEAESDADELDAQDQIQVPLPPQG